MFEVHAGCILVFYISGFFVRVVLKRNLTEDPRRVFPELSPQPVAAASLGQATAFWVYCLGLML